jgi:hypothetical protein
MRSFHKFSQRTCLVLLRLCKHSHVIYLAASPLFSYTMFSSLSPSNPPPPAERGAEITDKLRSHPSLVTKPGTAILGNGLLAMAISQELYVFNEGTVIAVGYFILVACIAQSAYSAFGCEFLISFSIFFSLGGLPMV